MWSSALPSTWNVHLSWSETFSWGKALHNQHGLLTKVCLAMTIHAQVMQAVISDWSHMFHMTHTSPSLHLYRATTHILWHIPSHGLFLGEHRGAFVELKPFPWEVSYPSPPQHTPIFHTQHTPSHDVWSEFLLLTCSGVVRIFVMPGPKVDAERLQLMAFRDCLHNS